jgi:hypothetical protein
MINEYYDQYIRSKAELLQIRWNVCHTYRKCDQTIKQSIFIGQINWMQNKEQ